MALTWAAPRIARQARSPPAIPMTTRTTSNTPSTPSRQAPPGEITSLCSQVSQLLPHRGLTPTGGSGPATQRLHIAPQLPNGANPSQPRSRPPRVILGPLIADSSFFLNVYLTFWEKNNGWYEWFFQKVYLDDLKKPLRQKGVLTSVRKYPRHSKSSKNFLHCYKFRRLAANFPLFECLFYPHLPVGRDDFYGMFRRTPIWRR